MNNRIPILMYHQVSPDPHPNFLEYTVTPQIFKNQLKIIESFRYTPINFDTLLAAKNGETELPEKPIILTFDDALVDALRYAVPILEDKNFCATFYVTTGYVGRISSWMIPDVNCEFEVADWQTIKGLAAKGFEIGAHSVSHPLMDKISPERCYKEMSESRRALEEALGRKVRHMAYPHGAYNQTAVKLAGEVGYYTACTCEFYLAGLNSEFLELPRINIGMRDSSLDFVFKLHTARSSKMIMSDAVNSIRRRVPKSVKRFIKKSLLHRNP